MNAIESVCEADGLIALIDGAEAIVEGVAVETTLASPLPLLLMARIVMSYAVPFVRPVITMGDAVEAGERVVHVVPPSVENW